MHLAAKLIANVTKRLITRPAAIAEYAHWDSKSTSNKWNTQCTWISFMNHKQKKRSKLKEQPVLGK